MKVGVAPWGGRGIKLEGKLVLACHGGSSVVSTMDILGLQVGGTDKEFW